jgi:molecular chaperone GrpE
MQSSAETESEPAAPGQATADEPQGAADGTPAPQATADETPALSQMEDRLKRALADLDNYRKRAAKEIERRVLESRERLLRDWLEAVDSIDRALQQDPDGPAAAGLRAVRDQMESILARQGVSRIGETGEQFDPERHEAVGVRETGDAPDRSVVEVARSGYALGDRVLRPAQVVVSRSG